MSWDPHLDDPDVVSKSDSAHWDRTRTSPFPQTPPCAPLLKDLDSFTEGTSVGSFDFSLSPSPASPNVYYQLEPAPSLGPGPDPEDLTRTIETWRDGVIMSVVGPRDRLTLDEGDGIGCHGLRHGGVKRHRSCTSLDGEWDECKLVRGRAGRMLLGLPACGPSRAAFVTPWSSVRDETNAPPPAHRLSHGQTVLAPGKG